MEVLQFGTSNIEHEHDLQIAVEETVMVMVFVFVFTKFYNSLKGI